MNRALVCALLAHGETTLSGALFADDTEAMLQCIHSLGAQVIIDRGSAQIRVNGVSGVPGESGAVLDTFMSGTTARFVSAVAALSPAAVLIDGHDQLRARPMGDLWKVLEQLGADIEPLGEIGHLPVTVSGGPVVGGDIAISGAVSSQFLSAILLAAPEMRRGLNVQILPPVVSRPYVNMTVEVMKSFGAEVRTEDEHRISVAPRRYVAPERYHIEPDASAASYFFALPMILGGKVRVDGLGTAALQGDMAFVDALQLMGATVRQGDDWTEVEHVGPYRGIEIDMADFSDTAQTLAAVAVYATSPTVVTGIGFIRKKETDRIHAVVTELQRLGVRAEEQADGFTIWPSEPQPGIVQTYDDHRMAMSFALLGLRSAGIEIYDPDCVGKTFPTYWDVLDTVTATGR